jgi:protein TonB
MNRALQGGLALALALGAHVAAFAAMPKGSAESIPEAAGEGGAALISLAPAPADLADLIKAWESPPPVEPAPEALPDPVADAAPVLESVPDLPMPDAPAAVALPVPDPAPKADTPPEKPVVKAEAPAPKPKVAKAEKPKAEQPKDPAPPAQKAKGKGKGQTAGEGEQQTAGALSAGQVKSLTADWGAKIAARIERAKRYPSQAKGATGRVGLALTVAADGQLRGVKVRKSSGNPVLDAAAIATVKAASPFAKAPKGVPETRMSVTLRFEAP